LAVRVVGRVGLNAPHLVVLGRGTCLALRADERFLMNDGGCRRRRGNRAMCVPDSRVAAMADDGFLMSDSRAAASR